MQFGQTVNWRRKKSLSYFINLAFFTTQFQTTSFKLLPQLSWFSGVLSCTFARFRLVGLLALSHCHISHNFFWPFKHDHYNSLAWCDIFRLILLIFYVTWFVNSLQREYFPFSKVILLKIKFSLQISFCLQNFQMF